ncbi:hypothetical protein TNCV_5136291 [Trichonephila clavipes]|nr:hypothetical protein TNCV_5136291 [Trichonephila clavipes]
MGSVLGEPTPLEQIILDGDNCTILVTLLFDTLCMVNLTISGTFVFCQRAYRIVSFCCWAPGWKYGTYVSGYTFEFCTLLNANCKKKLIEWCMKAGLIALNYECSKCNERMGLYERKSAVLDGDFEWVCSTITSQNIYGRTPMIILLTMKPSRVLLKSAVML